MHDLRRLLVLVPYFQNNPGRTTAEAAQDFGISEKQVLQDLKLLYMCGLPGQGGGDIIDVEIISASDDDDEFAAGGEVRITNADYLTRPLRLTPDEALSLILALDFAQDIASTALAANLASARDKLRAAVGEKALEAGAAITAGGDPQIRDAIASACAQRRQLQLTFDGQQRTSRPVVEPARMFVRDGYPYLQAYSLERDDWRYYRLDRIAEATVLDIAATVREVPAIDDISWAEALPIVDEVELTVLPQARWIAEYYPTLDVRGDTIRLGIASAAWFATLVLRLGADVTDIQPRDAAGVAADQARAALARYASVTFGESA